MHDEHHSDTSLSLPSPRRLAGLESSPLPVSVSPTLYVTSRRERGARVECNEPLFLGDRSSPSPVRPPARPRRPRLTAEERAAKREERLNVLLERQRWREANRVRQRREDTMQDIIVRVDADLGRDTLASVMPTLREKLEKDGASVQMVAPSLAQSPNKFGMIVFERRVRSEYDAIQKLWAPLDEEHIVRESTHLHIASATSLLESIHDDTLVQCIFQAVPPALGSNVSVDGPPRHILVVLGLESFLRQHRTVQNRAYTESVRQRVQTGQSAGSIRLPTQEDPRAEIDRTLLRLQMLHACHVVCIPQPSDAVEWLHSIACDVSIRPYKLLETARNVPSRASRTITGKTNMATYQAMLQQIPRCTPPVIYAITELYPTFRALMEAFEGATPERGEELLAAIEVRNGRTTRHLGPQLARHIYQTFMSENGGLSID